MKILLSTALLLVQLLHIEARGPPFDSLSISASIPVSVSFPNTNLISFPVAIRFLILILLPLSNKCGAVTTSEWGAMDPRLVEALEQPVNLVIIQHTVSQECYTDERCESIVRNIQWYHMMDLGWKDIAYNFLIGGNGKVYEGVGWQNVGSHSLGYNRRSIGIAFIGDFRTKEPTPAALRAAQRLLKCGVNKRHLPRNYFLVGHMQVRPTESPGARLMELIKQWPNWIEDISVIDSGN
ncbi:Peptidoglycan recognition protein [Eumeta japonica]|uniref:Peptidoglycan recognition protein n=1 Tax=Eumeta variegata TaxID=151549 RepID=A0A4C1TU44_EUMVA|nr:Peptidoglycan recognition protein [Eumeta japonica]